MDGFLSEGVKDTITILGLAWTLIQIAMTILVSISSPNNSATNLNAKSQSREADNKPSISETQRRILLQEVRSDFMMFIGTVVAVFVLSALLHYVTDKGLIISLFMALFIYQFWAILEFLGSINEWFMSTLKDTHQIKVWRISLSLIWFFTLLLCISSIGRFDPSSNWFTTGLTVEMVGILFGSFLMLLYLTYVQIERLLLKRWKGRA